MLDRIKTFIKHKGLSVRKFEQALGMSNGTIHNATVNGSSISSQWMGKITEQYPELNISWLITGKGSMISGKSNIAKNKIPYFNVDFSGGFVELYNDQTQHPTGFVDMTNVQGAQLWCNIKGHSMEPTIADGDRIALQNVAPNDSINYGSIYAIVTDDGLRTVKRIERSENEGKLLLVADNKDYNPVEISKTSITHLFRVVAHLGVF
ncbi:MAG: hypothetical protein MJZ23_01495 [Paludibacteraceae bacterium]|nr:hypothetical protein [Paludibacteraceae bacterium]